MPEMSRLSKKSMAKTVTPAARLPTFRGRTAWQGNTDVVPCPAACAAKHPYPFDPWRSDVRILRTCTAAVLKTALPGHVGAAPRQDGIHGRFTDPPPGLGPPGLSEAVASTTVPVLPRFRAQRSITMLTFAALFAGNSCIHSHHAARYANRRCLPVCRDLLQPLQHEQTSASGAWRLVGLP